MTPQELEFKEYITEKLKDKKVSLLVYAVTSFDKQRDGFHAIMVECHDKYPEAYKNLPWLSHLICGWADDLCEMYSQIFPDFMTRFGTGITTGKIKEITRSAMFGDNIGS